MIHNCCGCYVLVEKRSKDQPRIFQLILTRNLWKDCTPWEAADFATFNFIMENVLNELNEGEISVFCPWRILTDNFILRLHNFLTLRHNQAHHNEQKWLIIQCTCVIYMLPIYCIGLCSDGSVHQSRWKLEWESWNERDITRRETYQTEWNGGTTASSQNPEDAYINLITGIINGATLLKDDCNCSPLQWRGFWMW